MKYIVYKTTNLVNNKIYIGVHQTKDPNIFDGYIGCAIQNKNSIYIKHPKTAFHYAVAKYGYDNFKREIIKSFDNEEEAYALEEFLVDEEFLARDDVYNMILGGRTDCITRKIVYLYDLNGNYINEFKGTRIIANFLGVNNSCITRAIKYKLKCKNYLLSYNKINKLDISEYNIDTISNLNIYIYDLDGNLIDECISVNETVKKYKIHNNKIKESCIFGILINNLHFCYIKSDKYDKAYLEYTKSRKVYQYDKNGNLIHEYNHQFDAELIYSTSNINKSIKTKELCSNNYYWGLEKLDKFNSPKINKKKKVAKLDINGNILKIWESGRECEREVGSGVRHVLHNLADLHKGYKYIYLEDNIQ